MAHQWWFQAFEFFLMESPTVLFCLCVLIFGRK